MATVYQNPARHLEERLDDLIGRMTLPEKLGQLAAVVVKDTAAVSEMDAADWLRGFIDSRLSDGAACVVGLAGAASAAAMSGRALVDELQRNMREDTRLGIPLLICERLQDALSAAGVCPGPVPLGQAATFNPGLVQRLAEHQREFLRSLGVRQVLAPVLDVARDPRWRKLETTYGEDPYLVGRMGVACIRGLQGDSVETGVLATAGHFLGCALAQGGRRYGSVEVGHRELREVFAEPFAAAVREAGVHSVMCADSAIDGEVCTGSVGFIEDLLRHELGFWGMIVAEWYGVERLVSEHRVAATRIEAAALALAAGVDVELPGAECFGEPLEAALDRRLVSVELVNRAVRRVLRQKFELGLFDADVASASAVEVSGSSAAYQALTGQLSEQSLVMLKNEDVLPLAQGKRIALVGPGAESAGSSARSAGVSETVSLLSAMQQITGVQLQHAAGCSAAADAQLSASAVAQVLAGADVAIVCLDNQPRSADADADLQLPAAQQQLLQQTLQSGIPAIVVAFGTTIFMLGEFLDPAAAVLVAWRQGEQGGVALANVLTGGGNPSGRLPIAVIRHVGQLPAHYNQRTSTSGAADQVAFPFGHGLCYSSFEYDEPNCVATVDSHGAVELSLTVKNTSERTGDEVVQLYFHDPVAEVTRPRRQLLGFQRVTLTPGETKRVLFQIDVSQFAYYNRQMEYVVDPGQIELMVGASSADIRLRYPLSVEGERRQIKQQQRLATQSYEQELVK